MLIKSHEKLPKGTWGLIKAKTIKLIQVILGRWIQFISQNLKDRDVLCEISYFLRYKNVSISIFHIFLELSINVIFLKRC